VRQAKLQIIGTLSFCLKGALIPFDRFNSQWRVVWLGEFFSQIVDVFS
jgi:hypothetical protein